MNKILRDIPIEKQIAKHMQWWERRREEWQRQAVPSLRPQPKKLGPYISFSREVASGGIEISQQVAEKLGWQYYDREIIEAIANRTHVREELVARFDEHVQNELDTYLRNLFTMQMLNNTQYLHHLTQVLLSIARYGNAVILGRGANFILPPEGGLRVRVVAPMEVRLRRLMQEKGLDEKHAAQELAERDKERRDYLQHHFRCKQDDPCAYDVVINTGHIDFEMATDFIIQLAKTKLKKLM
ncbi:MAG: cytidylate kinase-like family protein [candidate division KSB1 bacterium]|nr:cytidylate kinase-like family protein [candidate division KSB1 bacterium]MDZ7302827.1 cytidylate kinase-like family protein [candidate division KSB1 bacterium]MDZ7311844.1 cytidylate kinase-like family protein [candidate division KSB1 bacterium]